MNMQQQRIAHDVESKSQTQKTTYYAIYFAVQNQAKTIYGVRIVCSWDGGIVIRRGHAWGYNAGDFPVLDFQLLCVFSVRKVNSYTRFVHFSMLIIIKSLLKRKHKVRYHYILIKKPKIKRTNNIKCWQGCGELKMSFIVSNIYQYNNFGKSVLQYLLKLNIHIPYDPQIPPNYIPYRNVYICVLQRQVQEHS